MKRLHSKGEEEMRAKEREEIVVTSSDKRLLSMDGFCIYAGLGSLFLRKQKTNMELRNLPGKRTLAF